MKLKIIHIEMLYTEMLDFKLLFIIFMLVLVFNFKFKLIYFYEQEFLKWYYDFVNQSCFIFQELIYFHYQNSN